ncbi:hypothetical protein EV421DRAFT_1742093 [Armillaria borealis]|uniref:CCHC-type domain-containing protein n=1 Tax=Armillaria borealis TaxID=47425 RepID=A0AA39IZZ6_9AGAR|nr:hypothetical protein EV421DRAFT_1742093 [Armillaria borealis]
MSGIGFTNTLIYDDYPYVRGNMDSDTQDDGGQDTGTKKARKNGTQSKNDAHTPTDTAGPSGKKKTLAFEENIKDADPENNRDSSYSLDDMDREYEPFAIPDATGRKIDTENRLGLSTKDLADEGFIQLTGFQSNSTFNSLQNSPVTKREPLLSDSPWWKGEPRLNTETPAHPKPADHELCSPTGAPAHPQPADHEPCSAAETLAHAKLPAPLPTNTATAPTISSSRQDKPIIISSDDEENDSEYTSARKEVRKLLSDETQIKTEVLADLGEMTPAETIIARAFTHGQTMKAFERLGFTDVPSDSEEFIVEYNANLATILIGRSFLSPENLGEQSKLDPKTRRQPEIKIEKTGKKIPTFKEDEMRAVKEKVTLQRIRNSQLRDRMKPTIPDQGIIFDENNNPWLKPDFVETDTPSKQNHAGQKLHNHDGGPPDNGNDPDDDDDENNGNRQRDPFMPRPWPRGSIEAKIRDQEQQYQKIIEFIHANLKQRLQIPDGLKSLRWDSKTMTKYSGSESKDIFWQWLKSVVFAYRSSQLGGPECDEERVLILDLLLDDEAKLWFQECISRINEPKPSFVDVIVEMMHETHSKRQDGQMAMAEYRAGTTRYYDLLKTWTLCLINTQSKRNKMSIEYNSLEELFESALDGEYTVRMQKRFSKATRMNYPGDKTEDMDKGKNQTGDYKPRFLGYQKNKGVFRSGNQRDYHQTVREKHNRYQEEAAPSKQKAEREPRREDGNANTKCFTPKDKTAERQKWGPICYRCSGIGHVAANEICPEYGKKPTQAQIRVAHTIIMGSMEGVDADDDTYKSEGEASSTTHQQEEFDILEFEEYNGFSEEESDKEIDRHE